VKRLVVVAVLALSLLGAAAAQAHPLGNFTINRFSRVEFSGDRVYVLYVLDLAEIPTFQARQQVRALGSDDYASHTAAQLLRHLSLTAGGRPVTLHPLGHALAFPPGQAGLRTTRLEVVYGSGAIRSGAQNVAYRDANFADRIGWKEIVVRADAGATLHSSTAPRASISQELRAYPKDLLQSPLDVTSAGASFSPGSGPGVVPALDSRRTLDQRVAVRAVSDGGFAALIGRDRLPLGAVLLSLLVALFWGAAHALSPGHGKTIVTAYLVGAHGTRRDAVLLGVTVTITHTIGVFALGLVTLSLSQFLLPEDLYPWLNLVSAVLVVAVGAAVVAQRLRAARGRGRPHDHTHPHDHAHPHAHEHAHPHPHSHTRGILGVGISGGLIPCPTALVVLLAAISLHRIGYGLVLILAFSIGLAATMTGIGILAVSARRVFERVDFNGGLVRLLPALSAFAILGLGLAMTIRALPAVT
jgi:nickel/cobalt exporter